MTIKKTLPVSISMIMAQTSAHKCYICTDKNSVFYCYDCQHALCAVCRERHDKIPAINGHTITDIHIINLSNVQSDKYRCITHEKDYQFYCVKCNDVICGKCVTSSHKGHSFSDISDEVLVKKEAAQSALKQIQSKIDVISGVSDKLRGTHLEKLHLDSHHVFGDIKETFKDIQTFTMSKNDIKKTDVKDNESMERQRIELFLKNNDFIHDRYAQVLTTLQTILCEKHDITFYQLYKDVEKDIACLDDIPKEPMLPRVPCLDKPMLYTEITEYMQSKTETRICKNCITQDKKLDESFEKNKQLQRDVDGITAKLKTASNEVKRLMISIKDMKTEYAKKQEENKRMSNEILFLKESYQTQYQPAWKSMPQPARGDYMPPSSRYEPATSYSSQYECMMCTECDVPDSSGAQFCQNCGRNLVPYRSNMQ